MLIVRLLVSVFGGFATHQLYGPTHQFGPRWGSMLRYVIGSLAVMPFRLLVFTALGQHVAHERRENDVERVIMSDLLALGGFGTGVFLGYMLDDYRNSGGK